MGGREEEIKSFISEFIRGQYSEINIKDGFPIRVTTITNKEGLIVGKKGHRIKELRKQVIERFGDTKIDVRENQ